MSLDTGATPLDPAAAPLDPAAALERVRRPLRPHCAWHVGAVLAAGGHLDAARAWLRHGAATEPVPGCACLLAYLDHHGGLVPPGEGTFADPRPFVDFTTTPPVRGAREGFVEYASESLPGSARPLRLVDLGCGDGALTQGLVEAMLRRGTIPGVGEIRLVDASRRMLDRAEARMREAFPGARVEGVQARIEEACQRLPEGLDVAVSAFAFHHLPREAKLVAASRLARAVDHLVLMEVEGNHDLPELHAPELSVSLYQVYGGGAGFVLSAGAAPEVSEASVERFLFAEVVSMLTRPRGVRSEYHMLRGQWMEVLGEGLGAGFQLRADDTLHSDGRVEMFMLHLGKG